MNIENLLNKYFEGETSAEEERLLRQFFTSQEVPEHLFSYIPLFAYFDQEIEKETKGQKKKQTIYVTFYTRHRKKIHWISGVAAGMLILLSLGHFYLFPGSVFCQENYVVINGRCYTDIHKIRQHAFNALQEVSTSPDEFFSTIEPELNDREIIENQLKELGNLFKEEEE
ncbi:hypothetical protein D0T51_06250 [Parabacteroides sp. 52]|uniref:hypothetical protein n=1 Tax=unclassified Parabacteroides TaxID=2649774 RepID=UPI0013D88994|nr:MULTISPECIES: hypothetical protein [unclassified Parabacteroides]MDH6534284.1 hypothetical protein [Parabacteroides sp. PM5-20]NDV55332.1 hypothetical protein [Parabacteroides sp. 52]